VVKVGIWAFVAVVGYNMLVFGGLIGVVLLSSVLFAVGAFGEHLDQGH
jgi:hypothetical protein